MLTVARDRVRFTHPLLASPSTARRTGRSSSSCTSASPTSSTIRKSVHSTWRCARPRPTKPWRRSWSGSASAARRGAQDAAAISTTLPLRSRPRRRTPLVPDGSWAEHRPPRSRRSGGRTGTGGARRRDGAPGADASRRSARAESDCIGQAGRRTRAARLSPARARRRRRDRQLSGMIQAKLGMYSDEDHAQAVEHSEAASRSSTKTPTPGCSRTRCSTLLFYGAQTGRGIDEGLLQRALELEGARAATPSEARLCLIWYQCTDAHEGHGAAPAGGRVVPRPGRGDLGRREARASRARGVTAGQLGARAGARSNRVTRSSSPSAFRGRSRCRSGRTHVLTRWRSYRGCPRGAPAAARNPELAARQRLVRNVPPRSARLHRPGRGRLRRRRPRVRRARLPAGVDRRLRPLRVPRTPIMSRPRSASATSSRPRAFSTASNDARRAHRGSGRA